jgi:hypothetical protein
MRKEKGERRKEKGERRKEKGERRKERDTFAFIPVEDLFLIII